MTGLRLIRHSSLHEGEKKKRGRIKQIIGRDWRKIIQKYGNLDKTQKYREVKEKIYWRGERKRRS